MDTILTNIGTLLETAASTQEGRKNLLEISAAIHMYVAGKTLPVEPEKPINTFPDGYTLIDDINRKIKNEFDRINSIINDNDTIHSFYSLFKYMTCEVPGILLIQHIKVNVIRNIDNCITKLETSHMDIPDAKMYLNEFRIMRININCYRRIRFSWYEDDKRITVIQLEMDNFREIRRGDLTGYKLKEARTWNNFKDLCVYLSDNNITEKEIATYYG